MLLISNKQFKVTEKMPCQIFLIVFKLSFDNWKPGSDHLEQMDSDP